jgi:cytosine/adenosine deaminase-related metal-dependent hydrolase
VESDATSSWWRHPVRIFLFPFSFFLFPCVLVIKYRAAWVLPITGDPIPNSWIALDRGRIVALGRPNDGGGAGVVDLGHAVILPGLVNAHTHLELSYLRSVVARSDRFIEWIRVLIARRREFPDPADPRILDAACDGIHEARAAGTALLGDISNTLVTPPLLAQTEMPAVVFYELLKFDETDPIGRVQRARQQLDALPSYPDIRTSIAPHAPYSVAPLLFRAIRADLDRHPFHPSTVHLAESAEEVQFLKAADGPWRELLQEIGVWTSEWKPPGGSPVAYLADAGFLDRRVLVVHGVQCTAPDLSRLASIGSTIVACPRSNRYVGVGSPPLDAFYRSGVTVAFGTDSLASVDDLNVFGELAEARRIAPAIPARRFLESATLAGARALRFEGEFGSIEPGKRAALLSVSLPETVDDVEEYLVSGIDPSMIRWLDAR